MSVIAGWLLFAVLCTFLLTASILPFYLWRSWRGFAGWVGYIFASVIALAAAAFDLFPPFSDQSPGGSLASVLSVVGIALSLRLLCGEIRDRPAGRESEARHPWFGDESGPI